MNKEDQVISSFINVLKYSLSEDFLKVTRITDREFLCDVLIFDTKQVIKDVLINIHEIKSHGNGKESVNLIVECDYPLEAYSGTHELAVSKFNVIPPTPEQIKAVKSSEYNGSIDEIKKAFIEDYFKLYALDLMCSSDPVYQCRINENTWITAYQDPNIIPLIAIDDSSDLLVATVEIIDIDMSTNSFQIRSSETKGNSYNFSVNWEPIDRTKAYPELPEVTLSNVIERS